MASIKKYTDKNGNTAYRFQIYLGTDPITGKVKKTTRTGFKTKRAASLEYSRLKLEAEKGTLFTSKKIPTFKELYELWFETHKLRIKPNTQDSIETIFRVRILPHFGHLKIDKITPMMCQKILNQWATSYRSFNENKIRFSMVMDYGIKMGLIPYNPMDRVDTPKSQVPPSEKTGNFLSKSEFEEYMTYIKIECDNKMYTFFRLVGFTGLRKGEALALTWDDIDFTNSTVSVTKTAYYRSKTKAYNIDSPKTAKSVRTIGLDSITLETLKSWKNEQRKTLLAIGLGADIKNSLVFSKMTKNRELEYVNNSTPNRELNKIIKKYDLNPITVHGLRHTHTTLLAESGVIPNTAMKRLGHSKIETTLGLYTHVTDKMEEDGLDMFKEHIGF